METNIYMRHLQVLSSLQAEENLNNLKISDNKNKLKYKESRKDYDKLYKQYENEIKKEIKHRKNITFDRSALDRL